MHQSQYSMTPFESSALGGGWLGSGSPFSRALPSEMIGPQDP